MAASSVSPEPLCILKSEYLHFLALQLHTRFTEGQMTAKTKGPSSEIVII